MKLTFLTATLRAAYAAATAAVPTKTAREVLRNVLLTSSVDGCKIISSDRRDRICVRPGLDSLRARRRLHVGGVRRRH